MPTLYHIGFSWGHAVVPKAKDVEPTIDKLGSWVRLSTWNWYLWSNKSEVEIYNALKAHTYQTGRGNEDLLFVAALDPERVFGWVPVWFWTWLGEGKNKADPAAIDDELLRFLLEHKPKT